MLLYKPKPQDAGGLGRVGHLTPVWWDGLTYWNPDGTAAALTESSPNAQVGPALNATPVRALQSCQG